MLKREGRALTSVIDTLERLVPPIQIAPAPGSHAPIQALPILVEPLQESPTVQKPSPKLAETPTKKAAPPGDTSFFVEPDFAPVLAKAIEANLNVLLVGPSGSGKSSLLERLANRIDKNKPAVVSLHGEWSADDFFGGKEARDGSTYDRYGIATIAMMQRRRLIIHEFDAAPAEILFSLQRVLEKEALVLTQFADDANLPLEINPWVPLDYEKKMPDGSVRRVRRQPKFSILATANTLGHGDDTGLYKGTKALNHSTLDRFDLIKTMTYPSREIEATIIRKRTGLDETNAHRITQVAEMARKAAGAGLEVRKLLAPITMRQTLGWARLIAQLGCSPGQAFIFTVSDRSPLEERKTLAEIFNLAFGKDPAA